MDNEPIKYFCPSTRAIFPQSKNFLIFHLFSVASWPVLLVWALVKSSIWAAQGTLAFHLCLDYFGLRYTVFCLQHAYSSQVSR